MNPSSGESLTRVTGPDLVAEILRSVTMKTIVFCRAELRAPWGFRVAFPQVAIFHIVLQGRCWVSKDGAQPICLVAGDTIVFPNADAHEMNDHPDTPRRPIQELIAEHPMKEHRWRYGGAGPVTTMLCGGFQLSDPKLNLLDMLLPPVLHITSGSDDASMQLRTLCQCIEAELEVTRPGKEAIVTRLAEVFLLRATRDYLLSSPSGEKGLAAILRDPAIARVLGLIHQYPERSWTVDTLANEAGLSRSAFATRFKVRIGDSPQHYLQRCRLNKAVHFLQTPGVAIAEIASRVGYDSESSFSKWFKHFMGEAPGAYRRRTSSGRPIGDAATGGN